MVDKMGVKKDEVDKNEFDPQLEWKVRVVVAATVK